MAAVGLPLALAAAGGPATPDSISAAALAAPAHTIEQRVAIARARQAQAHPLWRTLSNSERIDRLLMLGRRMMTAAGAGNAAAGATASFQGNLTLIDGPSGKAIELQRQADCSLSYSYGSYTLSLTAPTIDVLATTPHYERTLHAAAGLTTTAGAFAKGCSDPTLGIGTRRGFYLGRTSQSLYMFAATGYNFTANADALYSGSIDVATQKVHAFANDVSLPNIDSMTAGDLNGDGLADVVGLDRSSGTVAVWLARADGTLAAAQRYPTGGVRAHAAVLADFDGDGKVDLVVATAASNSGTAQQSIAFLRGRGDGSFEAARAFDVSSRSTSYTALPVTLIAVDLRGTGRPDIVGSNGLVLLNNGGGNFSQAGWAFPATPASTAWGPTLASGDFNEDGKADIAVNNGVSVAIYLGRGDGGFDTGRAYASDDSVGYITATDLDGDGHADLYIGLANGGFFGGDQFGVGRGYALMGRGDGSFAGAPVLPFVFNGHNLIDLNGDGKLDAVGVNSDFTFTTYLGDGRGGFTPHATLAPSPLKLGNETFLIGEIDSYDFADVDGDGKLDLVFLAHNFGARNSTADFYSPGFLIALGDGQGGFATPTFLPSPILAPAGDFDASLTISNVRLADVNRDGKADLVFAFASTAFRTNLRTIGTAVLLGNGDGSFQAPKLLPFYARPDDRTGQDLRSDVQQIVDLNGDGKPDLLLVTQTATRDPTLSGLRAEIQVALGAGDGSFAAPVSVAGPEIFVHTSLASRLDPIVVADMNGDGIADLVMLGASSGYDAQVAIALGNGDGSFKAPDRTTFAVQSLGFTQSVAVADFNGDGKADVLFANPFGAAGVAFGRGDGTLAPLGAAGAAAFNLVLKLPVGGTTRVLELNGDGQPDVLVGDTLLLSAAAAAPTGADFALAASSEAGTVQAGQSVQTTLTLSPSAGYSGDISFACAGLPRGASCSFAPATVAMHGAAASTTLTVSTTAVASAALWRGGDPGLPGGLLLATLAGAALWRRGGASAVARRLRASLLVASGALALAACGGGSSGDAGGAGAAPPESGITPAGSYTIVVTATDGTVSRSVAYALQVN